jgi:hypothetical protein
LARRAKPVFVNCPFDEDYRPLFNAMIFTVLRCGFTPRCALEVIDGGSTRISKIENLIEECQLGIHDISRTELDAANALPRFNMPLELGLFLGAKRYGDPRQRRKKCLVLDVERFRYQKFMSDIAGQDIEAHGGDAHRLIERVRAFLNSTLRGAILPSGAIISADYDRLGENMAVICQRLEIDAGALEFKDFSWVVADFLAVGDGGQR